MKVRNKTKTTQITSRSWVLVSKSINILLCLLTSQFHTSIRQHAKGTRVSHMTNHSLFRIRKGEWNIFKVQILYVGRRLKLQVNCGVEVFTFWCTIILPLKRWKRQTSNFIFIKFSVTYRFATGICARLLPTFHSIININGDDITFF